MKADWAVEIAGVGVSTPTRVVTNDDIAARLDTSDEWIVQRTGIRERRYVAPDESTLDLALAASREALAEAGVTADAVDLIVFATATPEHPLPATGNELQHALGCRTIPSFDVGAACSGFVYAFVTGAHYCVSGFVRTALVIGAECLTRITDMEDRASCILFGDAAGAVVIRLSEDPARKILAAQLGSDGGGAKMIWIPAGGSREPASERSVRERLHYMRLQGREVFKFAVTKMRDLIRETLDEAGCKVEDLALVIPHQSNSRIIEAACQKIGLSPEQVIINIDRYGNTSSASIPLALHEAMRGGRIKRGDLVMMVAFGAGLTWASTLLRI